MRSRLLPLFTLTVALLAGPALAQSAAPASAPSPAASAPQAPPAAVQPAAPPPAQPAPLLVPPPIPDAKTLAAMPPPDLARGYLAAVAALPLARQAAMGQGVLNLGFDGVGYRVNSANAGPFITFLQARVDTFGDAITKRGSKPIDGQYSIVAGPGCTGEKYDPRIIFSPGKAPNGTILMASGIRIITNGAESDMLVTLIQNRQTIGVVMTGAAVDDTVIFGNVLSMGYSLYGSIAANTIALRFDPDEVKNALGADAGTEADWKRLEGCVFTLTKK